MMELKIDDKIYEQLLELSYEMKEQDNRGTASPYGYVLHHKKKNYVPDNCGSDVVYIDDNSEEYSFDEVKEYYEQMIIEDSDFADKYDDFEDYLSEKYREVSIDYNDCYVDEMRTGGFFLTEKAIREHIVYNKHNYSHTIHDFVIHCFRNPEMELVQNLIKNLSNRNNFFELRCRDHFYILRFDKEKNRYFVDVKIINKWEIEDFEEYHQLTYLFEDGTDFEINYNEAKTSIFIEEDGEERVVSCNYDTLNNICYELNQVIVEEEIEEDRKTRNENLFYWGENLLERPFSSDMAKLHIKSIINKINT